jgi:hypothetical protein
MVLCLISSLRESELSRVRTIDKCFLLPMELGLHNHLGSSFILMFVNHGLSVCSVFRMWVIRCGEGLSSHVEIPMSTLSITICGQGLSSLMALT